MTSSCIDRKGCNVFSHSHAATDRQRVLHYSDVTWSSWRLKLPATQLFIYCLFKRTKNGSSVSLAIVREIHIDSTHKWPVMAETFSCYDTCITLQWRHNETDGVSNHQPHDCLLNRLFRRRSKETSKLRVTGLCARNSPGTGEFPAQRPVTRKMSSFDDVIMHR